MTSTIGELERRLHLLQKIADLEGCTCQMDLDLLYERWRVLTAIADMEAGGADWRPIAELRERAALLNQIAHAEEAAA